jgi:hypothetical protein
MGVQIIYLILVSVMAIVSIGFYVSAMPGALFVIRKRFGQSAEKKEEAEGRNLFSVGTFNVSLFSYQLVRFSFLGLWLVSIIVLGVSESLPPLGLQILLIFGFYIVTIPKKKIGRIKLPFLYITSFLGKVRKEEANKEIYRTISQLINLFTIKGDQILGSNYILEEVIKHARVTKPIYLKMLSMWNMNMRSQAADYFSQAIGTREAEDLARIFLKLDFISPGELKGQLIHYRNNIKTEKITARQRTNERNGNLIYILAIVSAVVVLINFLVVVLTDVFTSYNLLSF